MSISRHFDSILRSAIRIRCARDEVYRARILKQLKTEQRLLQVYSLMCPDLYELDDHQRSRASARADMAHGRLHANRIRQDVSFLFGQKVAAQFDKAMASSLDLVLLMTVLEDHEANPRVADPIQARRLRAEPESAYRDALWRAIEVFEELLEQIRHANRLLPR